MSFSFTRTATSTFTIVHARYLASKVAADMHLCAHYYGHPSEQQIRDYAEELAQYLNEGYIQEYEFGYKKDGRRLVTWRYRIDENGVITTDDRPGKVVAYVDVSGARFFNFLTHNARWLRLSLEERERLKNCLPIQRTEGQPPTDGDGYWVSDRNYFSGGQGLGRETFRPLS